MSPRPLVKVTEYDEKGQPVEKEVFVPGIITEPRLDRLEQKLEAVQADQQRDRAELASIRKAIPPK